MPNLKLATSYASTLLDQAAPPGAILGGCSAAEAERLIADGLAEATDAEATHTLRSADELAARSAHVTEPEPPKPARRGRRKAAPAAPEEGADG